MRGKGNYRTYRGKRQLATSLTLLCALALVAAPASGAPAAPVIDAPTQDAFTAGPIAQLEGTSVGSVVLVRIFEGATLLADTGTQNGSWRASVGLSDGSHTITVYGRDSAGVWSAPSAPRTFIVDSVAPAAPVITAPLDGDVLGFSLLTVEGTAEPFAHVTVTDAAGPVLHATANASGAWAAEWNFADTTHTLTATATDRAGNTSLNSPQTTFTVDTRGPAAPTITAPARDGFVGTTTVAIAGFAEAGSLVKVFEGATILMTSPVSDGTWSGTATFTPGAHTISARAFDPVGNPSLPSALLNFVVDLTPPAAPVFTSPAPGAYVADPVTITGTTEPYARVELRAGIVTSRVAHADRYGAFAFTLEMPSGTYTFTARATDRAGNIGPESPPLTFTADAGVPEVYLETPNGTIFLPGQFPLIKGRARDEIGVAGVRLDYYDLLGKLAYRQTASCWECPAGVDVEWRVEMSPPIGRYEVYAYAIDRVGHESLPAKAIIVKL